MDKQTQGKALDVAIAGAGIAGPALAIALKQSLGRGFSVTVFDPALSREPAKDERVVAIAGGARRLFEAIGVWDSKLHDAVRQTFLEFSEDEDGEPLGHMVENRALIAALREAAEEAEVGLISASIDAYAADENFVRFDADGNEYRTRLLAAADGAQSKLRTLAKIRTISHDYDQSGIVATIGHARAHDGKAVQHFLPGGSFAFLPLTGNRSSIVWTERTVEAARITALSPSAFLSELELRFGLRLGELE
jgi:2-octaprenyl-6-methoxyphenol hydroxylase